MGFLGTGDLLWGRLGHEEVEFVVGNYVTLSGHDNCPSLALTFLYNKGVSKAYTEYPLDGQERASGAKRTTNTG